MLHGKTYYLWTVKDVLKGNLGAIVDRAKEARLKGIVIKVLDGPWSYNVKVPLYTDTILPALIPMLQAQGIEVYGYQYVYGVNPVAEAKAAIARIAKLHLDGFVVDAEGEFKKKGMAAIARRYMVDLRTALPHFPIALTSYRYPTLHPEFQWKEFVSRSDFCMPQVYWEKAHNPAAQMIRCLSEYRNMTKQWVANMLIVPIGAAYKWMGWKPNAKEMNEFNETVQALKLPGISWWEWGCASRAGLESVLHGSDFKEN